MAYYPVLAGEIAKRGMKRSVIASSIGISARSLYNKMAGKTPLTWTEAKEISGRFFPDMTMTDLLATASEIKGA